MRPSVSGRVAALLLGTLVVAGLVMVRAWPLRPEARPPQFRADVLVMGGSPAGVSAALAAARQGLVVVLAEPRPFLGTVWTGAMLNMVDLNRLPDNKTPLVRGIFDEVHRELGDVFDPRAARELLLAKVEADHRITLLLGASLVRPLVESKRAIGAVLRLPDESTRPVDARVTIDATDDGDLAAAAGVPFTVGREVSGVDRRTMPATLMFRIAGVDWDTAAAYAQARRRGRQPSGARGRYVWGFRDLMRDYEPNEPALSAHDLNLGRLDDGTVYVNALQVHDVDALDRDARAAGYLRAKREIPHFLDYLRARVPGFAGGQLIEVAPELYIRETRHLEGLYVLTARDIAARTLFWDRVAAASYPVDLHQYVKGERYPFRPVRSPYTIPLRALIAAGVDGTFIASRAFSATYEAAGSARVIPTTMAMGEAAGVASAVAIEHNVTPHQMPAHSALIREVQRRLVAAGAVLAF